MDFAIRHDSHADLAGALNEEVTDGESRDTAGHPIDEMPIVLPLGLRDPEPRTELVRTYPDEQSLTPVPS
jgi:hypothetical protein